MGFHTCEYCTTTPATSSGDITLRFDNGNLYQLPDMLPHYIKAHGYLPPLPFVDDVLNTSFSKGARRQTRSLSQTPEPIGYLHGDFSKGEVPAHFLSKLEEVMALAAGLKSKSTQDSSANSGKAYRGAKDTPNNNT